MHMVSDDEMDAFRYLWCLAAQADLRNGVTDSTGTVDEGEVNGWQLLEEVRDLFLRHAIDPRTGPLQTGQETRCPCETDEETL